MDFNDTDPVAAAARSRPSREAVRGALVANLRQWLPHLFPTGRLAGHVFKLGDIAGAAGDSLEVALDGAHAGLWIDRATDERGDVFALIAAAHGLDVHRDFPQVLRLAADLAGETRTVTAAPQRGPAVDELGPAVARYEYRDASDRLLLVVTRYEPGGKKTYRVWDVTRRKWAVPAMRPLYNQAGMARAGSVILAEGEKCAQALIEAGFCATTALCGAQAPVEKTDWSPLGGKAVLIWPDHDTPGAQYAQRAAQAALAAGATSCAILIPPPDKPQAWDAADALAEGFGVADFIADGLRETVLAMPDRTDSPMIDPTTEAGLAHAFSTHVAGNWRYCAAWNDWLLWNGQRWCTDETLYVQCVARQVCERVASEIGAAALRRKLASAATVFAVERLARADRRHSTGADDWDSDPWLLNTPGGTVDLHTGTVHPHRRKDAITRITGATPSDAPCPTWERFLTEVMDGYAERVAYLQRVAGYCLTGLTSEHALFFLYGTGANGKSVFVNVLATILGDYASSAPMETFMEAHGERHPTDLAGLQGARLVAATETEQGRRWSESRIKILTGGDRIAARFMRQDFFEYTPQFKLLIAGNHKPSLRNVDEAMRRRLHLIPFTVTIPPGRRDRELTARLLTERDAILGWMVRGTLGWQQDGLRPPASVIAATAEYFEMEDVKGQWIAQSCTRDPLLCTLTVSLYASWKAAAEAAGEPPGSLKSFSQELVALGFARWRDSQGRMGFRGIGLKPQRSSHDPDP